MAATTMRLSCTFLDLSTELIIEILSHLPASDLLSVQRTCHTTHDIITGTAYLQYILRSHIHGVGDFLPPDFPHSERLELLQRHERSRKALRFDFLTECVAHMPYSDRFTLRDGYLIYESLTASTPQYGYTNLSSGARNEEVRWVHITMDKSRLPLPLKIIFAPDHDLVAAISQQSDYASVRVHLTFLKFTTGAPHPLSSTHIVSLPPLHGLRFTYASAEVLGDHILVLVRNPSNKVTLYLVSWKTGTVTLISEASPIATHTTTPHSGRFKPLIIENSVFALMKDTANNLVVCKLKITPSPCFQTVCVLELPPPRSGVSLVLYEVLMEWIPTSKDYTRSRSFRGLHAPFYSSTVGTIALLLDYHVPWEGHRGPFRYTMVISVQAFLAVMRTGVRNVPWVDWGPASTHLFERTPLKTAGPSWITNLSPLVVRNHSLMRTRYCEPAADETWVFSTKLPGRHWESKSIETRLPYNDVVANDLDFGPFGCVMADREWIVGILRVEGGISVAIYHIS